MAVLVQKFGGTSVGDLTCIRRVARRVKQTLDQGHQVVVVVSAMAGETDRLVHLAHALADGSSPCGREYDVLVSAGEQVSTALLAMCLSEMGYQARSFTGRAAGILTDDRHKKARILDMNTDEMQNFLQAGGVPIVAGFQGVSPLGEVTTFGRGGSDITAVALAAKLAAVECQIFSDVPGILTADPNMVPKARCMREISFDEMLELSSLGSQVVQFRAVEFAKKYHVPIRVLSSFNPGAGTLIIDRQEGAMESPLISGMAFDDKQVKLSLRDLPAGYAGVRHLLKVLNEAGTDVDMMLQIPSEQAGKMHFSFTVHREDKKLASDAVAQVLSQLQGGVLQSLRDVAKVSIVGVGVCHPGILMQILEVLEQRDIEVHLVCTTETKVAMIIDEHQVQAALQELHDVLALESQPELVSA